MFRPRHNGYRAMQALAIFALCLRVLVPGGYMPASVADGWYLQWCPDGVSVEVLEILFASAEASPAHAHHHGAPSPADEQAESGSYAQCDLSGFSADAQAASPLPSILAGVLTTAATPLLPAPPATARVVAYRSRAPPIVVI